MTVFWSFRSPYSYLALPRLAALSQETGVSIEMRVVHPNILRNPHYFKTMNPLARPYFMRDTARMAAFLGMPFRRPVPDPIAQDPQTLEVGPDQPLARRLGYLGIAAVQAGQGLGFCRAVSTLLWDGQTDQWHEGDHLRRVCDGLGLDWDRMDSSVRQDPARYERELSKNADALTAAGHWGVPTVSYGGETFFGQDRIDVLRWHIKRCQDM